MSPWATSTQQVNCVALNPVSALKQSFYVGTEKLPAAVNHEWVNVYL